MPLAQKRTDREYDDLLDLMRVPAPRAPFEAYSLAKLGRKQPRDGVIIGLQTTGIEVIGRHLKPSFIPGRYYSNGLWEVKCHCGKLYIVSTVDLKRKSKRAHSCGCKAFKKSSRKLDFATRPPVVDLAGQFIGRFYVRYWIPRIGWEVECKCGTAETYRNTQYMRRASVKRCNHITAVVTRG